MKNIAEIQNIISIGDRKAAVVWGMNSSGFLYLKSLETTGSSIMDELTLSKGALKEAIKMMNEYNKEKAEKK